MICVTLRAAISPRHRVFPTNKRQVCKRQNDPVPLSKKTLFPFSLMLFHHRSRCHFLRPFAVAPGFLCCLFYRLVLALFFRTCPAEVFFSWHNFADEIKRSHLSRTQGLSCRCPAFHPAFLRWPWIKVVSTDIPRRQIPSVRCSDVRIRRAQVAGQIADMPSIQKETVRSIASTRTAQASFS